MNVPKQTGEIFELLSKGEFICSNASDEKQRKLYDIIDDEENFEALSSYFNAINFTLERGDEYFYFSRPEAKADLERKIENAFRWIDLVDFFKTHDSAFASGYRFTPADITVKINVDAVLKNKADGLRKITKAEDKTSYSEIVLKAVELLCKDGFAEMENEILKSYKVLSSFKYLEELVLKINIPEDVKDEIPK